MRKVSYLLIILLGILLTACRKENRFDNSAVSNYVEDKKENELSTADDNVEELEAEKGIKGKPQLNIGESPAILWEAPCNTEEEQAIKYISEAGYWKRPLGLYSYAVYNDYLFIEDSANQRIVWLQEHGNTQIIELPEGMIGIQMVYAKEENILYLLLFDNIAVEANTLSYCKVDLSRSLTIENIEEVPYDTRLNYLGQPIPEVGALDALQVEKLVKQAEQIESLKNGEMSTIKYITECEDIRLYMYYLLQSNEGVLLLVRDKKIIAHSERLYLGAYSGSFPSCAYLYVNDENINITYMSESDNKIEIIKPTLIEVKE